MNIKKLCLFSAIVAMCGTSLVATTQTEAPKDNNATAEKTAKDQKVPTPTTMTEVSINDVEKSLNSKTIIVDARPESMVKEVVQGAINIPADADNNVIAEKLKDKNAEIIAYCGGGSCPAGKTLAERLVGLGYTNVKHYAGGIKEWKNNNKPTTALSTEPQK